MLFWTKKNDEVVLDCYTYSDFAYDFAKINYATKFFPDWWKKTSKTVMCEDEEVMTIKNCVAFMNFYKMGIVIPSWFELRVTIKHDEDEPNYSWAASNADVDTGGSHSNVQFKLFSEDDSLNMKIQSVWKFKASDNINFSWTQPTWNNKTMLRYMNILPGVVDFKYQHSTHINYLLRSEGKEECEVEIESRTPLVILHPLTEKNIKIVNHKVTKDEWEKLTHIKGMQLADRIQNRMTQYKRRKKLIDEIERKCPFGHD